MTETTRCMRRYTIPVDDKAWTHWLTSDPVHVANGVTLDEVEFWAEYTEDAPKVHRSFRVFGTGRPLPADARYIGTCPRVSGLIWHLFEIVSDDRGVQS